MRRGRRTRSRLFSKIRARRPNLFRVLSVETLEFERPKLRVRVKK